MIFMSLLYEDASYKAGKVRDQQGQNKNKKTPLYQIML